ncbi:Peptidyl-prolyl cis-trans isomerase-like 3 [Schistosoma japonicum]|nr:Peptidyl-prolyl cis-trans isomerase-like 3 [Schistosoma japonicum]
MAAVTLHTDLGDLKVELFCMQAPLASEYEPAIMLLNSAAYRSLARRSVLLTCSPASIPYIINTFVRIGGPVNRTIYWPLQSKIQSVGTLLIETSSTESLRYTMLRISSFHPIYCTINSNHSKSILKLPIFRVHSDPSIWPVENIAKYLSYQYPSELYTQANFSVHPSVPSSKEMTNILMSCHSFDDQVSTLHKLTHLSEQDILARFILSDSIEEILCCIFPETKVSIFGSVTNGLGSINSDVDLVIELPLNFNDLNHFTANKQTNDISQLCHTNILSLDPDCLKNRFLSFMQVMLSRLDPLGFRHSRIYTGRVPILHFDQIHILKVGLDISWLVNSTLINNNELLHCGTRMAEILFLLTLCIPEIQKSITLLKYLARKLYLTRNGPSPGFTNFKLITLFINFLQVSNYAPSFIRLQAFLDNSFTLDDASTFSTHSHFLDLDRFPSMEHLLNNFLAYVSSIKPCDVIIDLRNGCLTPRSKFNHDINEDSVVSHKKNFILCPDPIYPQYNIWSGINEDQWLGFVQICRILQNLLKVKCDQEKKNNWGILALTDFNDFAKSTSVNDSSRHQFNFLALCASDYYKGCIFHRNIKGFIVQTGDPTGTGKNGQSIWKQKFKDEFHDSLRHNARGIVSMANNGPDSNGSQFFITYSKQTMLDMKYSIFGKVIDGWDVLDELERSPVEEKTYKPLTDIHIQNITIHANPFYFHSNDQTNAKLCLFPNGLNLYGQLVIGPPGSGKTTYCAAMHDFLVKLDKPTELKKEKQLSLLTSTQTSSSPLLPEDELMPNSLHLHLTSVHLVDSHYCSDAGKFIACVLTSLSAMLQLSIPHVNILSKADLIEQYGELDFNLDFFTEVLDLHYLIDRLHKTKSDNNDNDDVTNSQLLSDCKYTRLNQAIVDLIQDRSLVQFLLLDIQDLSHMERVMRYVDRANGYVFGPSEQHNLQSLLHSASGVELAPDWVGMVQEKYMSRSNTNNNTDINVQKNDNDDESHIDLFA